MKTRLTSVAIAVAVVATGCKKEEKHLGAPAPAGVESATVQGLAQDAAKYAGKTVAVEGLISGGCSDGDGVVLSDKTWRVEVKTSPGSSFQIPVRKGARLRAWGVVSLETEEGEHHEEAGEAKEHGKAEEKHEEPEIVLTARGVEWL